jgi:hypothetical protein
VLPVPEVVKVGVWPATGLLFASRKVTVTVEVAVLSAPTGLVPVMFEFKATAAPAVKTTVPSVLLIGAVIERVFVSAVTEDKVQVVTPLAFVAPQAVCELFDPLALKIGVSPLTGLLKASKRVTVTVDVATPLAITGPEPVMLEVATAGAPAVNVTVPSAFTIGVAIESVLISAFVEVMVQVATPLASVAEQAL